MRTGAAPVVTRCRASASMQPCRRSSGSQSSSRAGPANSRFEADVSPFSSCRSPQPALKRSYHSDRVTRKRPMVLRVRAVSTKTRDCDRTGR